MWVVNQLWRVVYYNEPSVCARSTYELDKRCGLFEYGGLADDYVSRFHLKWIEHDTSAEDLLGSADIQSLADLDNSYNIVREMKTCLITKSTVASFATATLIPFTPLLLSVYPFDDLLKHLLKIIM